MKIAIIGTGAVGGYFGAKLAHAGFDVSFLARGKQLETIRAKGLRIKSILGDFAVNDIKATDRISQLGPSDLIILAVKAWQIAEIREELNNITHSGSQVLPLQNGVLSTDELSETLDSKKVLGGLCRIISKIESPGVINHFGATPSIIFGEPDRSLSDRVEKINSIFDQSGIHSRISNDINSDIWKKFGFICTGGLMAVTRTTIGELRELPEVRSMLTELISEIITLAGKLDIDMGADFLDRTMDFIDSLPTEVTFSMARDIWEGRPSELDYLNGAVVRLGKNYKVDTPMNSFIYNVLKPMEIKARNRTY